MWTSWETGFVSCLVIEIPHQKWPDLITKNTIVLAGILYSFQASEVSPVPFAVVSQHRPHNNNHTFKTWILLIWRRWEARQLNGLPKATKHLAGEPKPDLLPRLPGQSQSLCFVFCSQACFFTHMLLGLHAWHIAKAMLPTAFSPGLFFTLHLKSDWGFNEGLIQLQKRRISYWNHFHNYFSEIIFQSCLVVSSFKLIAII